MPEGWGLSEVKEKPRAKVHKPRFSRYCWVEKRIHTGSMKSRYAGCYDQCEKEHREGKLTCWWHKKYEDEAQALLKKLQKEKERVMAEARENEQV
jgi:hypothetical protein